MSDYTMTFNDFNRRIDQCLAALPNELHSLDGITVGHARGIQSRLMILKRQIDDLICELSGGPLTKRRLLDLMGQKDYILHNGMTVTPVEYNAATNTATVIDEKGNKYVGIDLAQISKAVDPQLGT